jgi:hypothetical protein
MTDKIIEARRAGFEAHYIDINLERNEHWPDFYVNLPTRMCWEAWNAALDSVCVELPPTVSARDVCVALQLDSDDELGTEAMHIVNGAIQACAAMIHAAGVRTK